MTFGGRAQRAAAASIARTESTREARMSRRLPGVSGQAMLRPVRLTTASAPSSSPAHSPTDRPSHATVRTGPAGAAAPRDSTTTSSLPARTGAPARTQGNRFPLEAPPFGSWARLSPKRRAVATARRILLSYRQPIPGPLQLYGLARPELAALVASWGSARRTRRGSGAVCTGNAPIRSRRWPSFPAVRARLEAETRLGALPIVREAHSSDGFTRKFLLGLDAGKSIETVLMRFTGRVTACVSSQAGCAMGCVFCATGQMGFQRQLTPGEIVAQAVHVARDGGACGERTGSAGRHRAPPAQRRPHGHGRAAAQL